MPIHRAPVVLALALNRELQAAAVLPQVDPLAEAVNRVGEQQLLAILKRVRLGLQGFELVFQRTPALEVRVVVIEPFSGRRQQRRELIHKLGGAPFQRVQRVVEGIDHRQQMNHPPAQLLGVAHGLRTRAFVRQLADHQFQAVEIRHHRHAQRTDFIRLHVAVEKSQAVIRCIGEPFTHRIIEHRRQATGPEHRAHHGRHGDAEKDFFGPRFRHIPHRQRVIHHRQGNQRQGVAGQHQGVVVGGAQMHGQEQQRPGP
ncbi:hypothetical protein D3C80_1155130 [compost metagenome]